MLYVMGDIRQTEAQVKSVHLKALAMLRAVFPVSFGSAFPAIH